jgi:hypothetical protein
MHCQFLVLSRKRGKKSHEEHVAKELRGKEALYCSSEFVGAQKLLFAALSSEAIGLKGNVDLII